MSEENKEIGEDSQVDFTPVPNVIKKDNIDINENIGSFGKTVTAPQENLPEPIKDNDVVTSATQEVKIAAAIENKEEEKKINEQKKDEVNFERFTRTKNQRNSINKFKISLETKLNNKKSLTKIWLAYLGTIALLIIGCALFIVFDAKNLKHATGYNHIRDVKNCGLTGEIFAYLAVLLPAIPLFVLFIAWLIQINGTYKSPSYHFMFIIFLIISVIFFILSLILSSVYLSLTNHYILP